MIEKLKQDLIDNLEPYGYPASALSASSDVAVRSLCHSLEELNPTPNPATIDAALSEGIWRVLFSDAPPPSNGFFGPFKGKAFQVVDVPRLRYENRLCLFDGACEVSLVADWVVRSKDEWRVRFKTIKFSLFGSSLPAFQFPAGTERTWRLSYVDADLRLVRAALDGGRSTSRQLGLVAEGEGEARDSYLFVMQREKAL